MFDDPHFHDADNLEHSHLRHAGSSADDSGKIQEGQKVEPV